MIIGYRGIALTKMGPLGSSVHNTAPRPTLRMLAVTVIDVVTVTVMLTVARLLILLCFCPSSYSHIYNCRYSYSFSWSWSCNDRYGLVTHVPCLRLVFFLFVQASLQPANDQGKWEYFLVLLCPNCIPCLLSVAVHHMCSKVGLESELAHTCRVPPCHCWPRKMHPIHYDESWEGFEDFEGFETTLWRFIFKFPGHILPVY